MTKSDSQFQEAGDGVNKSNETQQVTSLDDLLKLDYNDLSISPASIKTYRANLRTYLNIQFDLRGVRDRISIPHFINIGEMDKKRQKSLGYTPSMLSTIKKYIGKMNSVLIIQHDLLYDESFKNQQHSSVISAVGQRNAIKNSTSKPLAVRMENLNQNLHNFIESYRNSYKHQRESTTISRIKKIRQFFGYKHYIKDGNRIDEKENPMLFSDELVDIITPEHFEGFSDHMRVRNGGITSTAVKVMETVFAVLSIDMPRVLIYINPLHSKDQKINSIGHRSGRKGLLNEIQQQYDETGQKKYMGRHSELINTEGEIFNVLTPEELEIYTHHAQAGYINNVRPKIKKLIEKYEKESKQRGMTRNPFLPLMPLLDLDDPLRPIHLALQKSAADIRELIKFPPSIETARAIRNHIFVSLISLWPLRRSHWLKMTYTTDQSGHISLSEKGDLLFRIPINDFKNSESNEFRKMRIKGETVDVPLMYADIGELVDLIKIYITVYLPLFKHGTSIMFYSSISSLVAGCKKWQSNYLHPICDELKIARPLLFGPHSFRHICVTSILKTGGTIDMAANLLLDRPETVRNRYSAFLPSDGLKFAIQKLVNHRKIMDGR